MQLACDHVAADELAVSVSEGLARIKTELGRSDIADEHLLDLLRDAIADLGLEFGAEDFVTGRCGAELRARICASLCLPQPPAPLVMPEQVLERSRLTFLERLRMTLRRVAN